MTENPSGKQEGLQSTPGRIKRELYIGKVRSWTTWVRKNGAGRPEIHVVCSQDVSAGLTLIRFGDLEVLNRFRESIDQIADEMNREQNAT